MSSLEKLPGAHCDTCSLRDQPLVNGFGPNKATLVIIGEAPGASEIRQGRPFVGDSGMLLNKVLERHGIDREQVYVTNAVACRPPDNKLAKHKDAVIACHDRLIAEVAAREPKKVLTLGGPAAQSLLGVKDGITKLRLGGARQLDLPTGEVETVQDEDEGEITVRQSISVNVVSTFHPAFALRNPDALPSIMNDVELVSPSHVTVGWEPTDFRVCHVAGTRILTRDLRWVPVETLRKGDELVAADEQHPEEMKHGVVLGRRKVDVHCYEVETPKGKMIVSEDHLWPVMPSPNKRRRWMTTKELYKRGYSKATLAFLSDPWETANSYEAGYISGLFDGEGSVSLRAHSRGPTKTLVMSIAQNPGGVLDRLLASLKKHEVNFRSYSHGDCINVEIRSKAHIFRALGIFQPPRLLEKFDKLWPGKRKYDVVPITGIRPVGVREVIAIGTDTKTFFAEGFLSHNCEDPNDAADFLEYQSKFPSIAIDIENGIEEESPYDARDVDWLCIGISHTPGRSIVYAENVVRDGRFRGALKQLLAQPEPRQVYQNGKYDIQALWEFAPDARVDEDSMLLHYSVDERKGTHGLEQLGTEYVGAPNWKSDAKTYLPKKGASYRLLPKDVLHRYNATDADVTHRLIEPLTKEMRGDDTEMVYRDLLIPGANALAHVEYRGIEIDLDFLNSSEASYLALCADIEAKLKKWVDNPRSSSQVKKALKEMAFDVESTNKETLAKLPGEFARLMLDYRDAHKVVSTYLTGLRKRIVRGNEIHPTFNLHGTETGRLSARNPNVQNQPRRGNIRSLYVARKGYRLIEADYHNIELRILAGEANAAYLKQVYAEGRNFHDEMSREFYGHTYKGPSADKEKYTRVKTVNFATPYGETPGHLAHRLDIPYKQADGIQKTFFRRNPEVRAWQRKISREIQERQFLTSLFGRRRRFWLVTNDNMHDVEKEGWAFVPQSPASDFMLTSLIRLTPPLRALGAYPIITVHDSLVVETPKGAEIEVIRLMKHVMEDYDYVVRLVAEFSYGYQWGKMAPLDVEELLK